MAHTTRTDKYGDKARDGKVHSWAKGGCSCGDACSYSKAGKTEHKKKANAYDYNAD